MKNVIIASFVGLSLLNLGCKSTTCHQKTACCKSKNISTEATKTTLDSLPEYQKLSYALAHTVASDMKKNGIDSIDINMLSEAFSDVLINDTNQLGEAETQAYMRSLTDSLRRKQQQEQMKQYLPNKTAGERFLDSLKSVEGVKFTASGLGYKILKTVNETYPKASDKVAANYIGKLIDGSVFDQSRGTPIEFPLTRVIKGWTEGLQLISEGGKIELYIPYYLAYGETGSGQRIPPYSALIFEVELVEVVDPHKGHNHAPGEHH